LTTSAGACPTCGAGLYTGAYATPWCTACRWNLDHYERGRRAGRDFHGKRTDRWAFRTAYRLNRGQFEELEGRTVDRPARGAATLALMGIAVVLLAGIVGLFAFGVYLVVDDFPNFRMLFGLCFIAIALMLRPRFGKRPPFAEEVRRADAPALFALVDEVAGAVGTPVPRTVVVDYRSFNAYATTHGILHRRVMCIGVPLWAALGPQERVALLGHELGHFVNGDLRRGPLTSVAFGTFATLSEITQDDERLGRGQSPLVDAFVRVVMALMNWVFGWAHVGVEMIGRRSHQRAEYYADSVAARVAGSRAVVRLLDVLTCDALVMTGVKRVAGRLRPVAEWTAAAAASIDEARASMIARRQLTARDGASLFASHPPSGLRAMMIESRPELSASVVLDGAASARIDQELAGHYDRYARHAKIT
jgi:heat shock protein HtpX